MAEPRVVIAGAGLAGALMAVFLARRGAQVELYERRGDPRAGAADGGRSINLAISERGLNALRVLGLEQEVLRSAVPMRGRMLHAIDGKLKFLPYDKDPARHINSISRGGLNRFLIDSAAGHPNVRIRFDSRCTGADLDRGAASFVDVSSGEPFEAAGDLLVGADGAFSAVRGALQRLDRFEYSQSYLAYGYKELTIPPAEGGGFRMEPNALHIWPRRSYMMIALPNVDGSFTCTCFWPYEGPNGFARLQTPELIRDYFAEQFPDAVPRMPTLVEDFQANPIGSLVTIRCAPWHYRDRVVLVGDAAHAIVPFFGQGMNAAFEDCVVLDECLRDHADDRGAALSEYTRRRKRNGDAIAALALENFVEMRDKSARPLFRAKKALERVLHGWLPGWFVPLYTLVSFTNVPYADAVERARGQNRVVYGVLLAVLAALLLAAGWLFSGCAGD